MPKWQKFDEFRIEVFIPAGPTPRRVRATLADPLLISRLRSAVRRTMFPKPEVKAVRVTVHR
jgi:hypothetical protein